VVAANSIEETANRDKDAMRMTFVLDQETLEHKENNRVQGERDAQLIIAEGLTKRDYKIQNN
jgi:hypothetical protein